jgi:hypothetical protein
MITVDNRQFNTSSSTMDGPAGTHYGPGAAGLLTVILGPRHEPDRLPRYRTAGPVTGPLDLDADTRFREALRVGVRYIDEHICYVNLSLCHFEHMESMVEQIGVALLSLGSHYKETRNTPIRSQRLKGMPAWEPARAGPSPR